MNKSRKKLFKVTFWNSSVNVSSGGQDLFSYPEWGAEIHPLGKKAWGKIVFIGTNKECWQHLELHPEYDETYF